AAATELRATAADPALVATLDAEARRLDRYIANLLDMVRIEAGAIRLNVEPVDLVDAVAAALRDVRGGDCVQVDVAADLPLLRLDAQLFHHILINLIDNARRHGAGAPVSIHAARRGDGVTLAVCDAGPGLPPGSEARVFDTFSRLAGSDRVGGTGLGLAIVKGFADAMAIGVSAANRSDARGAVFTLELPAPLLVAVTP
ncbi:MAG: sensor histidine kinase, partial [Polymorphobacter sp.]